MLLTRAPLSTTPKDGFSFDLHVLSLPPAFVLSQDQTLKLRDDHRNSQIETLRVHTVFNSGTHIEHLARGIDPRDKMQDAQCVDATTPPPAHPFNIHIFKQHTRHPAGWHKATRQKIEPTQNPLSTPSRDRPGTVR